MYTCQPSNMPSVRVNVLCTVPSQTRPSKQCAYRDRQVPRLGRVSTSYHQHKPSRQVVGLD